MKNSINKLFNPPLDIFVFKVYVYWFLIGIIIFLFFNNNISNVFEVLTLLIFSAGFFILRFLRGDIKYPIYPTILFSIMLLFSILSVFVSVDKYSSILSLLTYISLFIIFIISFNVFSNDKVVEWFLSWLKFIIFIFSLIGIIYYFLSYTQYFQSTTNSSFIAAAVLLLIIPIALYSYIFSNNLLSKIINLILTSVFILSLVLTFSYFAYILLVFEILFFIIVFRKYFFHDYFKIILFLILSLAMIFVSLSYKRSNSYLTHYSNTQLSNVLNLGSKDRIKLYDNELNIFYKNPILGYGIGTFKDVFKKYQNTPWLYVNHGYDFVLVDIIEIGIIGGLSLLLFFIYEIFYGFKSFIKSKELKKYNNKLSKGFIYIPILISITTIILYSLFENSLSYIYILFLIFILIAILSRYININIKEVNVLSKLIFSLSIIFILIGFDIFFATIFYNDGAKMLSSFNNTKGNILSAKNYFKESNTLFPFNSNTYIQLSLIDGGLKNNKGAANNLESALYYDSYSPNIYYELGSFYESEKLNKKSLYYFNKAYNFNPFYNPEYSLALGGFYLNNNKVKLEKHLYLKDINKYFILNSLHKRYYKTFDNNNYNNELSNIYFNLFVLTKNQKYLSLSNSLALVKISVKKGKKK